MKITGYLKTSLLDWPGKVSSVIFTVGCNFRCPFCHNRDLVVGENLELVKEKDLLSDLVKRKKWIDGLVITGGEPTLQPDLVKFSEKVKRLGLGIKLDTNGSRPEVVADLLGRGLIDLCAIDIKTDKETYSKVVGTKVSIGSIEKSLRLILKSKISFELRTTIVPAIHTQGNLFKAGKWLAALFDRLGVDSNRRVWVWQNFVGRNCLDSRLSGKKGYLLETVQRMKREITKESVVIHLRGW